MSQPESNQWKDKYFASLEEIEGKEKAWQEVESILRQALSRLTLAADTSDKRLTEQMESLRTAIRKNATVSQIGKQMEEISSSILRLDQQRDHTDIIKQQLSRIEENINKIKVPDGLRRETRALQKQLRQALDAHDLKPALDAYADYVTQVIAWLDAPQPESRDGLLGRLFGRKQTDDANGDLSETASADASALTVQTLPAADAETLPAFNQVLFDLIHRLDLPAELSANFDRIAARLCDPPSTTLARQIVEDIAELMARARQHVEREKKDIESFLSQLTGRLQELDQSLKETVSTHGETTSQGDAIDASLSAEVAGIRKSVSEAENIDQIKHSIQSHLSNIQMHMDARKQLEQSRIKRTELEIQRLKDSLSQVQEESSALRTRLIQERDRALHDTLTGLHNRLAYEERIALEYERWARYGHPLVLSIWDVDHFKRINDSYGHNAGDNVLKILGKLLSKQTRKSDFVARFGGEEFMLLLPETGIQAAFEVTEKLRQLIATAQFMYRGQQVPVTMSCGLAECLTGDTTESLYRRADAALYAAKQGGRNCCKIADPPTGRTTP
ncbi:diguanylate cyclase [Thiobaca trueperi]|uniref:diguanylate cyclase n=1 Tax=Thiobaca trueperi TaxID=127458 RepID=A0A4R3N6X8_9GAMM|nr:diguanylate cyclase [Thiobaca trueperi]TCT23886.1 diguanylate cyclase [Thiobaca trueperi]